MWQVQNGSEENAAEEICKLKNKTGQFRFYISTKLTSQFFQEQNKTHLMDDEEDIEDFLLDSRLKLAVTKDNPTSVINIEKM